MNENQEYTADEFGLEDFQSGRVIECLESITSGYRRAKLEAALKARAKELRFIGFASMLKAYREEVRSFNKSVVREENYTEFADQELELNTGEWKSDESGVYKFGPNGMVLACSHPIYPVKLMRSIDTGLVKVQLKYRTSYNSTKPYSVVTEPLSRISKASDIVALADKDISVTSGERAAALVEYLRTVLDKNRDVIPEVKSVSRMGWNEEGFAPYLGGVEFDSADSFRPVYRALTQKGSYEAWLKTAREIRSYSLPARIVLAASFASPLVGPLGCLPFFVHLWSADSGTGKTVAQMLGASVWGNPAAGGAFFQTFKSTSVGVELLAGFLHSIPVFLDELQLAKDRHGKINFNVYELASGTGKLRGNKGLGLDYTPKWANCFITSGETPLVSESDGAGALNRVIEIECKADSPAIRDGHRAANALKANYGHAGKIFVGRLSDEAVMKEAEQTYEVFFDVLTKMEATEKQAMSAALIITADYYATQWIFQDGKELKVQEVSDFLKTAKTVSLSERGYEAMCGWIASNANRFRESGTNDGRYGAFVNGYAVVNRKIWDDACAGMGLSSKALLSQLRSKGLLQVSGRCFTKNYRIDPAISVACVWMKLPVDEDGPNGNEDDLPF